MVTRKRLRRDGQDERSCYGHHLQEDHQEGEHTVACSPEVLDVRDQRGDRLDRAFGLCELLSPVQENRSAHDLNPLGDNGRGDQCRRGCDTPRQVLRFIAGALGDLGRTRTPLYPVLGEP